MSRDFHFILEHLNLSQQRSLWGHLGPFTLPYQRTSCALSGHSLALSLHPDISAFRHSCTSFTTCRWSTHATVFPCPTVPCPPHPLSLYFPRPAYRAVLRAVLVILLLHVARSVVCESRAGCPVLAFYWFALLCVRANRYGRSIPS
jgi:hypothetical protein